MFGHVKMKTSSPPSGQSAPIDKCKTTLFIESFQKNACRPGKTFHQGGRHQSYATSNPTAHNFETHWLQGKPVGGA